MARPRRSTRGRRSRTTGRHYRTRQTRKRKAFMRQTFGAKRVQSLPGIGNVYGRMLRVGGYMKAHVVINRFLKLRGNKQAFIKWLRRTTGASEYNAVQCYQGVRRWCRSHLKKRV